MRQCVKGIFFVSFCDDFSIINKELITPDLDLFWPPLPQQLCFTKTQLQQPKKSKHKKYADQDLS